MIFSLKKKNVAEIFWLALSQASVIASGFILIKVITTLVGPHTYGQINVYMTITVLINSLIYGPLSNGVQRIYSISIADGTFFQFVLALKDSLKKAIVLLSILLVLSGIVLIAIGYSKVYITCVFVVSFSLVSGMATVLASIQNAARNRKNYAFQQSLTPLLRIGVVYLILSLSASKEALIKYFLGYLIADFIMLLYAIYRTKKSLQEVGVSEGGELSIASYKSRLYEYVTPFIYWGIFTWIQASSDRWALSYFADFKIVGYYSVLYQLGVYPVSILGGLLSSFSYPILFQAATVKGIKAFEKLKNKYFLCIAGACGIVVCMWLGAFLLHPILFDLVVAKEFRTVSNRLPILVLSSGLIIVAQIIALVFNITLRTRKLIGVQVALPIICVIIMVLGAKYYQLDGVVYGSLLYSFLYLLSITIISIKEFAVLKNSINEG